MDDDIEVDASIVALLFETFTSSALVLTELSSKREKAAIRILISRSFHFVSQKLIFLNFVERLGWVGMVLSFCVRLYIHIWIETLTWALALAVA